MAEETRLDELIDQLNSALGDVTPYRLAVVDPAQVEHVTKNAHYMPIKTFKRLVQNIRRDGNLASVPFCWRRSDGMMVVLSGNHRVDAAREAGIQKMLVLYTNEDLSRSEQIAIQLSHNAVVGADHKQTLRELWAELMDLEFKEYTGLDETEMQALDASDVAGLRGGRLPMEDLHLLFLPGEIERVDEVIERVGGLKGRMYAAPFEQWETFFAALLRFKEAHVIYNSATALMEIVRITNEHLDALPVEAPEDV